MGLFTKPYARHTMPIGLINLLISISIFPLYLKVLFNILLSRNIFKCRWGLKMDFSLHIEKETKTLLLPMKFSKERN